MRATALNYENGASGFSEDHPQVENKRTTPPTDVKNPKPSKRSTIKTRSTNNWLFGSSINELPQTKLSLKIHIVRRYLYLKDIYFSDNVHMKTADKNALAQTIAEELISLWNEKAKLPTMDKKTVQIEINRTITKAINFMNTNKARKINDPQWIKKTLEDDYYHLYDIFQCRCFKNQKDIEKITMDKCKNECGIANFLLQEDFDYYVEQKFHWKEPFHGIGKNSKFVGTMEKNDNEIYPMLPTETNSEDTINDTLDQSAEGSESVNITDDEDECESSNENENDGNYQPSSSFMQKAGFAKGTKNMREYPTFISVCQRYAVSQRTASSLLNAIMVDLDEKDLSFYVSRKKVRTMVEKYGKQLVKEHQNISGIICISFDAKKSYTRDIHSKKSKNTEEMFTVTYEPGGDFLHHFIPDDGTGQSIGRGLYDVVNLYNSEDTLLAILSDGTAGENHKYSENRYFVS